VNPLLAQPFLYAYPVRLRPDQQPCGADDLVAQQHHPSYVEHYCGGSLAVRNGMTPLTLHGLPGIEIDASWKKIDARFQLTNSSPVNPQSVRSHNQNAQWTAGAGFTIRQGFRAGVSGFSGPFLEREVIDLNPGISARDFPARGIGFDTQWGHGRWSARAEWGRVEFRYPRFTVHPAVSAGYLEVKSTLTPRIYTAVRASSQQFSRVVDNFGGSADHFMPNRLSYEAAAGYHLNHLQTLKVGYVWLKVNGQTGTSGNVLGIQLVTSVNSLSRAF
jgi:hypothetical protein